MGVKNFGGKNPKYGKNLVVGVILDQFGKMYHTFPGFFPDHPLSHEENFQSNLAENMEVYAGEKTWGKISVFRKTNIQWIKFISE